MPPSHQEVIELFNNLSVQSTQSKFFDQVADNVDWWIVGSTPMSGSYDSKQAFMKATFNVLNSKVLAGPLLMNVRHVVAGGEYATAELEAIDIKCKNGMKYDMKYCWVVRFGGTDGRTIVMVRAYLDTDLLTRAIEQNQ